ncbi:hypothetical protein GCM10027169_12190 [Gordonia jinhuaensis]|uniref:Uncharacterized protein n=1 Tax=Gordonia jinhuaensis TaxID=1517702 RepID=A0A916T629_9ACTN|nr:DUF2563 family protein [Gordonia jinhuaensis]GGB31874.1 hypothetical protein GCM10011489_20120 [Gordonia jinhuaensis]
MEADPDRIDRGGNRARESAEYVDSAHSVLDGGSIAAQLFGGFPTCESAAAGIADVRQSHCDGLLAQQKSLNDIAVHAMTTAATLRRVDAAIAGALSRLGPR